LVAWRLRELSQHKVTPHVWQVRRCTQFDPIFTHSSHSWCFAGVTVLTASICAQLSMGFPFTIRCLTPKR